MGNNADFYVAISLMFFIPIVVVILKLKNLMQIECFAACIGCFAIGIILLMLFGIKKNDPSTYGVGAVFVIISNSIFGPIGFFAQLFINRRKREEEAQRKERVRMEEEERKRQETKKRRRIS